MELHPHPLWPVPHIPGPRILLLKGNWAGEGGREGIRLPSRAGTHFRSPHLLGPLFLLGGKRVGGSLLLMEPPPAALASKMD